MQIEAVHSKTDLIQFPFLKDILHLNVNLHPVRIRFHFLHFLRIILQARLQKSS